MVCDYICCSSSIKRDNFVNPFDFFIEPYAETFPFQYEANLAAELAPYLEIEPGGAALVANGEIYDDPELRAALAGARFATRSARRARRPMT